MNDSLKQRHQKGKRRKRKRKRKEKKKFWPGIWGNNLRRATCYLFHTVSCSCNCIWLYRIIKKLKVFLLSSEKVRGEIQRNREGKKVKSPYYWERNQEDGFFFFLNVTVLVPPPPLYTSTPHWSMHIHARKINLEFKIKKAKLIWNFKIFNTKTGFEIK